MIIDTLWSTRIWGDGQHNAFPSMARFGQWYYVAFRRAAGHQTREAEIAVIRSRHDDLAAWELVGEFNVGGDSRDPFICVVQDALHIYWHREPTDWLARSDDGVTWSSPTEVLTEFPDPADGTGLVLESRRTWHFRVRRGPDGSYFSLARCGSAAGGAAGVLLCRSVDGRTWRAVHGFGEGIQRHVSFGHEADLAFVSGDRLVAAIRVQNARGGGEGLIAHADPPYTEWRWYWAGVRNFGGPALWSTPHALILGARRITHDGDRYGLIWEVTPRGLVTPWMIPSGGDCAYQCFETAPDGTVLMVYYSSHERPWRRLPATHAADLYLARIEVAPQSPAWR